MKKKILMALALIGCAIVLVAGTIAGTVAYLTSTTGTISNTFTVGKVNISMVESVTNEYGAVTTGTTSTGNKYKLIPGHEYVKDPTITVTGGSESCYLFVKVENGISAIEAGTTIAAQMTANGWTALADQTGVYYKTYTSQEADLTVPVFANFTIANNADVTTYGSAKINITAYAIQQDGLTVDNAWTAVSTATSTNG